MIEAGTEVSDSDYPNSVMRLARTYGAPAEDSQFLSIQEAYGIQTAIRMKTDWIAHIEREGDGWVVIVYEPPHYLLNARIDRGSLRAAYALTLADYPILERDAAEGRRE